MQGQPVLVANHVKSVGILTGWLVAWPFGCSQPAPNAASTRYAGDGERLIIRSHRGADELAVYHRLMDLGVRSFATDDPETALAAVRTYDRQGAP